MPDEEIVNQEALGDVGTVDNSTPPEVDPAIAELTRVFEQRKGKKEETQEIQEERKDDAPVEPEGTKPPEGKTDELGFTQEQKSWLGRHLAEQTKKQSEPLLQQIATLQQQLAEALAKKSDTPTLAPVEDAINPEDTVYTKGDVLDLLSKLKDKDPDLAALKKMREESAYKNGYVEALRGMFREGNKEYNPDIQKAVAEALDEQGNPKSHVDPKIAAERNYLRALASVLSKQSPPATKDSIPGNGEKKPISPTGLPSGTRTDGVKPDNRKLDENTQKLLRSFNLGADWAHKKLAEGA